MEVSCKAERMVCIGWSLVSLIHVCLLSGFAVVKRGRDKLTGEPVAIKVRCKKKASRCPHRMVLCDSTPRPSEEAHGQMYLVPWASNLCAVHLYTFRMVHSA